MRLDIFHPLVKYLSSVYHVAGDRESNIATGTMAERILTDIPGLMNALVEAGVLDRRMFFDGPGSQNHCYLVIPPESPHEHEWRVGTVEQAIRHGCNGDLLLVCDCGQRRQVPNVWPGEVPAL